MFKMKKYYLLDYIKYHKYLRNMWDMGDMFTS